MPLGADQTAEMLDDFVIEPGALSFEELRPRR
jgi:hypothetical protein